MFALYYRTIDDGLFSETHNIRFQGHLTEKIFCPQASMVRKKNSLQLTFDKSIPDIR